MTHHIFLFDGTQNGLDDKHPTNIRLMYDLLDVDGQKVHYFEGPGNDERNIFTHLLGSAFGTGSDLIVESAIEEFKKDFQTGDKLSSGGFSRGGGNDRKFSKEIAQLGHETEIMCVFDTVFSMLPFGTLQQHTLFGDLHVSGMVKNARHAVALDEDRQAFAPNLMNKRPGVVEMWFPGNHADIGGGYADRGLADITLQWMLTEAHAVAGLNSKPLGAMQAPIAPHRERMPYLREKRVPCVLVDGEVSDLEPLIYQ